MQGGVLCPSHRKMYRSAGPDRLICVWTGRCRAHSGPNVRRKKQLHAHNFSVTTGPNVLHTFSHFAMSACPYPLLFLCHKNGSYIFHKYKWANHRLNPPMGKSKIVTRMGKGGGCYDPPLDFVIFSSILVFLVLNESFRRILHNAEKIFEKS